MKSDLALKDKGIMSKDKKLYIAVAVLIPLTIAVVVMTLDWAKGFIPIVIVAVGNGFVSTTWIVLAISRAHQISKKIGAKSKTHSLEINSSKRKKKVIERTISVILLVSAVTGLVYRLANDFPLYAVLTSILFILIFSSNIVFLLATTDE